MRLAVRPLLSRILLVFGSLAVTLLVLEVATRLFWPLPPKPSATVPSPPEYAHLPQIDGLWELSKPNVRAVARGALFETNSAGFRGPERSVEKPPNTFRLVVMGDSIAQGMGVAYEDTYAARIERRLAGDPLLGGRALEVLDIALGGLNLHWALYRLETLGLRYGPDLVVYGYTLNDIEGPDYIKSRRQEFTNPWAFEDAPLMLWRVLGPRVSELREELGSPEGSYRHELDVNYFENAKAWSQISDGLKDLARTLKELDVCGVVLIHTHLASLGRLHPFHAHYEVVGNEARRDGLTVIQSFPFFEGRSGRELWAAPQDSHPGVEAHAILADALETGLRELGPGCFRAHPQPGSDAAEALRSSASAKASLRSPQSPN